MHNKHLLLWPRSRLWLRSIGLTAFLSLSHPLLAEEDAVGRGRAAAIAQNTFGGKVLSVDEQEQVVTDGEGDDSSTDINVKYVVKLLQHGGRIKVIKLDASGKIL